MIVTLTMHMTTENLNEGGGVPIVAVGVGMIAKEDGTGTTTLPDQAATAILTTATAKTVPPRTTNHEHVNRLSPLDEGDGNGRRRRVRRPTHPIIIATTTIAVAIAVTVVWEGVIGTDTTEIKARTKTETDPPVKINAGTTDESLVAVTRMMLLTPPLVRPSSATTPTVMADGTTRMIRVVMMPHQQRKEGDVPRMMMLTPPLPLPIAVARTGVGVTAGTRKTAGGTMISAIDPMTVHEGVVTRTVQERGEATLRVIEVIPGKATDATRTRRRGGKRNGGSRHLVIRQ